MQSAKASLFIVIIYPAPQGLHNIRGQLTAIHRHIDASQQDDVQLVVRHGVTLRSRQLELLLHVHVYGARVVLQMPLPARAVRAQRAREGLHPLVDVHVPGQVYV